MLRLIGILIGSALAIGFLLLTLGTPQLSSSGSVTDQQSSGSDTEPLRNLQVTESIETSVGKFPNTDPVTDPEPDSLETDPELDPELGEALVEQLFAPEASREVVLPTEPEVVAAERWYAFWSPFRSELAANGFVSKLQESTGIDYRVVKVKTGVYEVAFAYIDDADIETKLERISSATGLELSGS
jgi:hypothetical protein